MAESMGARQASSTQRAFSPSATLPEVVTAVFCVCSSRGGEWCRSNWCVRKQELAAPHNHRDWQLHVYNDTQPFSRLSRRAAMMKMLNSTIFDCLIYKGYGQRVSERDHLPYPDAHFALELVRNAQIHRRCSTQWTRVALACG